ncbi:uncharacterized protein PV07_04206 [Cladophialophora immunda]|uniref:Uncharacterized protein n=1 Tax=Cladophialophora immunda TaxID=569365 RepID=A0A0D2B524_9EURO|nr:uncharacterized protein PV07_04206 [Cladophialophora immunda]KIW32677.1 hypothetical protein PV07_04206 [Cladophialophora immunda]
MAAPCRAPSWKGLVEEILQSTLENGLDIQQISADDLAKFPPGILPLLRTLPIELPEVDVEPVPSDNPEHFEFNMKGVLRFDHEQAARARNILDALENGATDPETLTQGVDICYELGGQRLFVLITSILYRHNRQPSEIHEIIARLAKPDARGLGWDSIITYNFDNFMEIALTDAAVPNAGWAMKGDRMCGDPCWLAIENQGRNPSARHQAVYHLHGYTPKKRFNIAGVGFVLADSQFKSRYAEGQPITPIFRLVENKYLGKPNHVALYVGCSFQDKYMNGLVKASFDRCYGRYHYALMKWPTKRNGKEPTQEEIRDASKQYLEIGVRPIWFDEFGEEKGLLERLA